MKTVKQVGWEGKIIILFAGIIGCAEISTEESVKSYNKMLQQFKLLFQEIINQDIKEFHKFLANTYAKFQITGNEACLMIFRGYPEESVSDSWTYDIDTAVTFALELKRRWLLTEFNKNRISSQKKISDISVGIHFGRVWINKTDNDEYEPEGYAINLAKKIKSHAQTSSYTHICLSESAYDKLYSFIDKTAYTFDIPRTLNIEGDSQSVKVLEIKYHFLPANWTHEGTKLFRMSTFEPSKDDIEIIEHARQIAPSNLWLQEEHIMMQIQNAYKELLTQRERKKLNALCKEYSESISAAGKNSPGSVLGTVNLLVCMISLLSKMKILERSTV